MQPQKKRVSQSIQQTRTTAGGSNIPMVKKVILTLHKGLPISSSSSSSSLNCVSINIIYMQLHNNKHESKYYVR